MIQWSCPRCSAHHHVTQWRGSAWDLTRVRNRRQSSTDTWCSVTVTPSDHQTLRSLSAVDMESLAVVYSAECPRPNEVELTGTEAEMEMLSECVGLEVSLERELTRQRRLACLYSTLKNWRVGCA